MLSKPQVIRFFAIGFAVSMCFSHYSSSAFFSDLDTLDEIRKEQCATSSCNETGYYSRLGRGIY